MAADGASMRAWAAQPLVATGLALTAITFFWHSRQGVTELIEDYVHERLVEVLLQLLVTFACAVGALASLYAIARIAVLAPIH